MTKKVETQVVVFTEELVDHVRICLFVAWDVHVFDIGAIVFPCFLEEGLELEADEIGFGAELESCANTVDVCVFARYDEHVGWVRRDGCIVSGCVRMRQG